MARRSSPPRRLKVLLISNDPGEFHLFQESFRALNIDLEIVADAQQAIAMWKTPKYGKNLPMLLLLNFADGKRGLETLQSVRSNTKLRRIPVIMLGSSRDGKHICRAYEMGVNAYLCKTADNFFDLIGDIQKFWLHRAELPDWS